MDLARAEEMVRQQVEMKRESEEIEDLVDEAYWVMELDPPELLRMSNLTNLLRILDELDNLVLRCYKRFGAWMGWFTQVLDTSKKQEFEELISKLVKDVRTYR